MATSPADPAAQISSAINRHAPDANGGLEDTKRELLRAQIRLARAKVAAIDAAADIKMLSAKVKSLVR